MLELEFVERCGRVRIEFHPVRPFRGFFFCLAGRYVGGPLSVRQKHRYVGVFPPQVVIQQRQTARKVLAGILETFVVVGQCRPHQVQLRYRSQPLDRRLARRGRGRIVPEGVQAKQILDGARYVRRIARDQGTKIPVGVFEIIDEFVRPLPVSVVIQAQVVVRFAQRAVQCKGGVHHSYGVEVKGLGEIGLAQFELEPGIVGKQLNGTLEQALRP